MNDQQDAELTALFERYAERYIHWIVRDSGGGVIRDFQTTYQLVGPPWKISSYVNYDFVDG